MKKELLGNGGLVDDTIGAFAIYRFPWKIAAWNVARLSPLRDERGRRLVTSPEQFHTETRARSFAVSEALRSFASGGSPYE